VIAHWMRCSITYEIRTCRRFSRDWPIDHSPTVNAPLVWASLVQITHTSTHTGLQVLASMWM